MIPEDSPAWRWGRAAAILAVAAALFLPAVWTRDPWDPDEPRYAEVTRQMALTGDLLVPRFNGEAYSEKPPLLFWLSLAAERIPGVPAGGGGRLVGAVASAATLVLTWRIGALIMGEATGALAAALLSGCLLFWHLAQSGVIDPLLAAWTTLAVHGFARHVRGRRGGMLLFYAACSLAVLAKGPVGLIVPALAALGFSAISSGWRGLWARHVLWGIPLAAAPALAWLLLAARRAGDGYLETMLFRQNVGRAVNAYVHPQPIWYYLVVLPLALLPLTLFLPWAVVTSWKERICGIRPMLLPLTWLAGTFAFFTLVSGKKTRYMLPLAPAAALLVAGWLMRRFLSAEGRIQGGARTLAALAAAGCGAAILVAAAALAGPGSLPSFLIEPLHAPESAEALAALQRALTWPGSLRLILPAALLAASCGAGLRLSLTRRPEALAVLLGGWLAFLAIAGAAWTPLVDPVKSARGLAMLVAEARAGGPVYVLDDNHPPGLNLHLEEDRLPVLRRRDERIRAAHDPEARFIGNDIDMDGLEERTGIQFVDRRCRRLGSDVFCVASALPPPADRAPQSRQPLSREPSSR